MADRSQIEWTDATWHPVRGCTRVSEGCRHCYAERFARRLWQGAYKGLVGRVGNEWRWTGEIRLVPELLRQPMGWKRPRRIFVNSMSDLFHPGVPDDFIDQIFAAMALSPQHTFQILTKRPERMRGYFGAALDSSAISGLGGRWCRAVSRLLGGHDPGVCQAFPLPHVWLGVSCEDQATADERIPLLLETPAAVHFVSCEPLLGPVDLTHCRPPGRYELDALIGYDCDRGWACDSLDWVIVGGESGPGARPMHPDWARSIRDQCVGAQVPFFFKQWGEWAPAPAPDDVPAQRRKPRAYMNNGGLCRPQHATCIVDWTGKRFAGRNLDGRTWDETPSRGDP